MSNKATIILHGVGGAGINIVNDILYSYNIEKLANLRVYTIDSTDKTVQAYPDLLETFYLIKSEKRRNRGLDGSGGERKNPELIKEYIANVKNYLDMFNLAEPKVNNFHIVIHSGSGGTGSTAGVILENELISAGNVVLPIVIGDCSSLLFTDNSIKTIESIENIAYRNKAAMPIVFYNNTIDGVTNRKTEKKVNAKITTLMTLIGAMLSSKIKNFDNEDIRKFFRPTLFKSIKVDHGIYELAVKIGVLDVGDAFLVRSINREDNETEVVITNPVLQAKIGYIIDEGLYDMFDKLPIHMFLRQDNIYKTFEDLETTYQDLEAKTKIRKKALRSNRNAEEDDSGLII